MESKPITEMRTIAPEFGFIDLYITRAFCIPLSTQPENYFEFPLYLQRAFSIVLIPMAPPRSNKKTEGRKKIDMKLIENESARTVTFSKRRSGIFKKATELSILCGARVAVLIFSLCGRAYTFGHPSVESVLSRFLNRAPPPSLQDSAEGRRIHAATIQQLKDQCEESREKLEKKRARRKELESALDRSPYHATEEKLSKMSVDQLKELKAKMESLREKLKARSVGEANVSAGEAAVTEVQKNTAVDLANVEGDGHGASTIPSDWLKL